MYDLFMVPLNFMSKLTLLWEQGRSNNAVDNSTYLRNSECLD